MNIHFEDISNFIALSNNGTLENMQILQLKLWNKYKNINITKTQVYETSIFSGATEKKRNSFNYEMMEL